MCVDDCDDLLLRCKYVNRGGMCVGECDDILVRCK